MKIAHNISAMNSQRHLVTNESKISKNLEKMSTGYKINSAADDAAGLAVSEKLRCIVIGLEQGTANAGDGISLVRTAEGAVEEIHAMLNRMKELSVQSANGTYDNEVDRAALQKELDALVTEVDRIVEYTHFNGIPLLNRDITDEILVDVIKITEYFDTGKPNRFLQENQPMALRGNTPMTLIPTTIPFLLV